MINGIIVSIYRNDGSGDDFHVVLFCLTFFEGKVHGFLENLSRLKSQDLNSPNFSWFFSLCLIQGFLSIQIEGLRRHF